MMLVATDMEMPKSCSDCDFCHGHICKRTGVDIIANPKNQCPLVEIVTCEDCDNRCMSGLCTKHNITVTKEFYCADAERKE